MVTSVPSSPRSRSMTSRSSMPLVSTPSTSSSTSPVLIPAAVGRTAVHDLVERRPLLLVVVAERDEDADVAVARDLLGGVPLLGRQQLGAARAPGRAGPRAGLRSSCSAERGSTIVAARPPSGTPRTARASRSPRRAGPAPKGPAAPAVAVQRLDAREDHLLPRGRVDVVLEHGVGDRLDRRARSAGIAGAGTGAVAVGDLGSSALARPPGSAAINKAANPIDAVFRCGLFMAASHQSSQGDGMKAGIARLSALARPRKDGVGSASACLLTRRIRDSLQIAATMEDAKHRDRILERPVEHDIRLDSEAPQARR